MASIFEYNEERAMRFIREDEYSRGEKPERNEETLRRRTWKAIRRGTWKPACAEDYQTSQ